MENKIPDYYLNFDETISKEGLFKLTLVEKPAIEKNVFLFNRQSPFEFSVDNERQIIMGPILIPEQKIYRNDKQVGEYNIIATAETISKLVMNFMKNKRTTEVNAHEHKTDSVDGLFIYNMWVSDKEMGIQPPDKFKDLPWGTAFACAKIDNPQIWADFKTGKLNGFSIEAFLGYSNKRPEETELSAIVSKILETKR